MESVGLLVNCVAMHPFFHTSTLTIFNGDNLGTVNDTNCLQEIRLNDNHDNSYPGFLSTLLHTFVST